MPLNSIVSTKIAHFDISAFVLTIPSPVKGSKFQLHSSPISDFRLLHYAIDSLLHTHCKWHKPEEEWPKCTYCPQQQHQWCRQCLLSSNIHNHCYLLKQPPVSCNALISISGTLYTTPIILYTYCIQYPPVYDECNISFPLITIQPRKIPTPIQSHEM